MRNVILEAARAAYSDEGKAVEFMEARRWGGAAKCPRCECEDVYAMRDAITGERNKDYRWRCRGCKKMFTVRTGTVLEESRLPLRVWVYAFVHATGHKKGIAALRIKHEFGLSYRTALFLMHRIRLAMSKPAPTEKLHGTIEVDETYVGGKPRMKGERYGNLRGRGTKKTMVVAMVQRGGDLRYTSVGRVTAKQIATMIRENVDLRSTLMTDENLAYRKIGREFEGGHGTTRHNRREYAKPGGIHSNTIESALSLLKRGVYGTFHSISKQHLHRYCEEFAFRWNHRFVDDGSCLEAAIRSSQGKRLVYRDSRKTGAA